MILFWRPSGRYIFSLLVLILFLFSCSKKDETKYARSKNNLFEAAKLKLAKYADIPLPIGYQFVDFENGTSVHLAGHETVGAPYQNSELFCYKGYLSFERVVAYYREHMERFGWQITDLSNADEGLLFCNKVHRFCCVSVRKGIKSKSDKNKNYIYLFVKHKLEEEKRYADINFKKTRDIWDS